MKPLVIVALFNKSPYILQPWADAGHNCYSFDIDADEGTRDNINYVIFDLKSPLHSPQITVREVLNWMTGAIDGYHDPDNTPDIVFSFGPCDDLASCGALHWAGKREKDHEFQTKALQLFMTGEKLADKCSVPFFSENPKGAISRLYRKPDLYFNPCDFGGYLPENDIHPLYPEIHPPRDAYNKQTGGWYGNGFVMPEEKRVAVLEKENPGWKKLGGKSKRTKEIRAATPRGLSQGIFEANHQFLLDRRKNR